MNDFRDRFASAIAHRYALDREIGCGGMALVFSAEDEKHRRTVAIKLLRPEVSSALGAERFLREIQIAASLNHPHIVPLYDSGEVDGFLYYVMPLIDGESLRERLTHRMQLSVEEVDCVARDLAEALDYAHSRGVLHRDIKPENVLLSAGHAMLADFGVAKAVSAAQNPELTAAGVAVGTPAYMSPEQAAGDTLLDARSDLYSLGCVLFETLAGEPLFTGPSVQAVVAKRFTLTAPDIAAVRDGVPPALGRAIKRLLARTPADRFESARELLSVLAQPSSDFPSPSKPDRSLAVLPLANTSGDPENEYFSDGITEEIINALSRIHDLHVASRTSSFSVKRTTNNLRELSATLKVRYVLEGSVRRAGSRIRIAVQLVDVAQDATVWSARYDRDLDDIFAVQAEIAESIADGLRTKMPGTRKDASASVEAYEEFLRGRHYWNRRGAGLARAIEHFQRAVQLDPQYAAAHAGLADSFCVQALYGVAPQSEAYAAASAAVKRALQLGADDPDVRCAAALVEVFFGWDLTRAEDHFRATTRTNPRHARAWAWLAQMNGYLGRDSVVQDAALRAHDADPLSPLTNGIAATGLLFCHRYHDAMQLVDAVADIDPDHIIISWVRGYCHMMLGDTDEAVRTYERNCEKQPSVPALSGLAAACGRAGRSQQADDALARMRELSGNRHPRWWECLALVELGRLEDAVDAACDSVRGRHWIGWGSGCQPLLEPIANHPRWQNAMRTAGLQWITESRLRFNEGLVSS